MKKTRFISSLLVSAFSFLSFFSASAQVVPGAFGYYEEALRFSQFGPMGSARMLGIGGAQNALGADPTNGLYNPAGLGLFRKSELSLTLGLNQANTFASYQGNRVDRPLSNFVVPQVAIVLTTLKPATDISKFRGGAFAINYTRTHDFNRETNFRGFNNENSIIDAFIDQAEGIPTSQIGNFGQLARAFDTYLINPVPGFDDLYDSFVLGFPEQVEVIFQEGSADRVQLSYGGNYDNRLFFGAGLGISSVTYSSFKDYTEFFTNEPLLDLNTQESIFIDGTGVSFNLGVIGKVNDAIRVGAAINSPTWFNLNEEFSAATSANYDNFYYPEGDTLLNNLTSVSDIFLTNYRFNSPWRVSLGTSLIIGKSGFISADVEYQDFSNMNLRSFDVDMGADNQTITNLYSNAFNVRVGGEYRYENFMLRGGANWQQDPTTLNDGVNRDILALSGGAGVRWEKFFIDLAVVNIRRDESYAPYTFFDGSGPIASFERKDLRVMLTAGLRF